jgi:predicted transglutaminase-like cysteine proteinase
MGRLRMMLEQAILFGFVFNASLTMAMSRDFSTLLSQGEEASLPFGWLDFCRRNPSECQPNRSGSPVKVDFSPYIYGLLVEITSKVNKEIQPVSDFDHYGLVDFWTYPTDGRGDCEDYALLKRKLLIERGVPQAALSLAVVMDSMNEGHAILLVRTELGDLVLDNMNDDIPSLPDTNYVLRKYQSPQNPSVWISPPTADLPNVVASQSIKANKKGGKIHVKHPKEIPNR